MRYRHFLLFSGNMSKRNPVLVHLYNLLRISLWMTAHPVWNQIIWRIRQNRDPPRRDRYASLANCHVAVAASGSDVDETTSYSSEFFSARLTRISQSPGYSFANHAPNRLPPTATGLIDQICWAIMRTTKAHVSRIVKNKSTWEKAPGLLVCRNLESPCEDQGRIFSDSIRFEAGKEKKHGYLVGKRFSTPFSAHYSV